MMHWARARRPPFVPQGIAKSGDQGLNSSTSTWTQVTSWAVHSAYPGTVVTSNGITLPARAACTLNLTLTFGGTASSNRCRILIDGVAVATSGMGAAVPTASYIVPYSDSARLVTVEAMSNGLTGVRTIQGGEANTNLIATP